MNLISNIEFVNDKYNLKYDYMLGMSMYKKSIGKI